MEATSVAGEAVCRKCGQEVEIEIEGTNDRRRNYTPNRPIQHVDPATIPEPSLPRIGHLPDKSAATHTPEPMFKPVTAPSHALEAVQRERGHIVALLIVVAGILGAVGLWVYRTKIHQEVAIGVVESVDDAVPMAKLLAGSYEKDLPIEEIEEATLFLRRKILAATSPEDWLPIIRKADAVAPLLREFYQNHPFPELKDLKVLSHRSVINPVGKFVVFAMEGGPLDVIMVELTNDGPLLDWELSTHYPEFQWNRFLENSPKDPETLAFLLQRCDPKDEFLAPTERAEKNKVIALKLGVPGGRSSLYSVIPLHGELSEWVRTNVPWEHASRGLPVRATVQHDPATTTGNRVTIQGTPSTTWNR